MHLWSQHADRRPTVGLQFESSAAVELSVTRLRMNVDAGRVDRLYLPVAGAIDMEPLALIDQARARSEAPPWPRQRLDFALPASARFAPERPPSIAF
jgi:hypothetical protein